MGVVRVSVVRVRLVVCCIVAPVTLVAHCTGALPVASLTITMPALIAALGGVLLRGFALVRVEVL